MAHFPCIGRETIVVGFLTWLFVSVTIITKNMSTDNISKGR